MGAGYALYFNLLQFIIGILLIIAVLQSIPNIIFNSKGTTCINTNICSNSKVLMWSFANRLENYHPNDIWSWLDLLIIVLLIVAFIFWRRRLRILTVKYDNENLSVSDYTVVLGGLPKDFGPYCIQDTILDWIKAEGEYDGNYEVVEISLTYDVKEFNDNEQNLNQLKATLKQNYTNSKIRIEIQNQIEELNKIQYQILNEFEIGISKKFLGCAYISFATQSMCQQFMSTFGVDGEFKKWRLRQGFGYTENGQFFTGKKGIKKTQVYAEPADEPDDIIWENYAVTDLQFFLRKCYTEFLNFMCLLVSSILLYLFTLISIKLSSEAQNASNESKSKYFLIELLIYAVSWIVVGISFVISSIIDYSASYCGYETLSKQDAAIAFANAKIIFANTALVSVFVAKAINNNYFSDSGLLVTAYGILSSNAYLTPLFTIFDRAWFWWQYQRWVFIRKKPEEIQLTQQQFHDKFFTLPDFPLGSLVGDKIVYVWTGAFFGGILPMGTVWCLFGLILAYPVEKYILIRRSSNSRQFSCKIIFDATETMEWVLIIYTIGLMLKGHLAKASGLTNSFGHPIPLIIALIISIIHAILPMDLINEWLFKVEGEIAGDESYAQAKDECNRDYRMVNPACKNNTKQFILNVKAQESKKIKIR